MSNVVAGISREQLKVLAQRVAKKQAIYQYYKQELGSLPGVEMMPMNDWQANNCWLSCITLTGKVRPIDIMLALEAENIESRPLWKPMHMQPFFAHYDFVGEGVAERLFDKGVCLQSDTKLTAADLARLVGVLTAVFSDVCPVL